ncbi:MAG: hypothetical protein MI674_00075 [Cytophagales bacterium]|nr:hypothetical protein [Cytophagales bacterium]
MRLSCLLKDKKIMCRLWLLILIVMLSDCSKKREPATEIPASEVTYHILARSVSMHVGDTIVLSLVSNKSLTNLRNISFEITDKNGQTERLENTYFTPHEEGTYTVAAFMGKTQVDSLKILVKENRAQEEQLAALKQQVADKEDEVTDLEQEVVAQEKQIAALEKEVVALKKEVADKEDEVAALEQEVEDKEKQRVDLERQLEARGEKRLSLINPLYDSLPLYGSPEPLPGHGNTESLYVWKDNPLYEENESDDGSISQEENVSRPLDSEGNTSSNNETDGGMSQGGSVSRPFDSASSMEPGRDLLKDP